MSDSVILSVSHGQSSSGLSESVSLENDTSHDDLEELKEIWRARSSSSHDSTNLRHSDLVADSKENTIVLLDTITSANSSALFRVVLVEDVSDEAELILDSIKYFVVHLGEYSRHSSHDGRLQSSKIVS